MQRDVRCGLLAGVVVCGVTVTLAATLGRPESRVQDDYSPVTDARLRQPESHNWLMYRGNYSGWGYSPLQQITSLNVADLSPAWVFHTGVYEEHHQAAPIVNDGRMYVTTAAQVIALDAETGALLWRYVRALPPDLQRPHPTNRGVALYEDKVYVGTLDAHVVALDATTGTVVWDHTLEDYRLSYYVTMAPLVANGKVMVGTSGGERGIRGSVTALDASTGRRVWKRSTIPAPGEPGSETWPDETWRHGGGPVWLTGTFDPLLNLTYWGVGNPGPWLGETRPGDNLFTNATIALDADTGELRAYHQYHWNGSWDWDEAAAPLLIDVRREGRNLRALVHPGRNGYLWLLERFADRITFVEGQPFVFQNVFADLDPVTGRPTYDPAHVPGIGRQAEFCPSLSGARNWPPEAYSPQTGMIYIPANNNLCSVMEGRSVEYRPGRPYTGADFETFPMEGTDHVGELQAWDLDTGRQVWERRFPAGNDGALLTTAGGLVFLGGGDFRAFNALSGRLLWQVRTNHQRTGVPTSYAVRGKQYVAVQSGADLPRDDHLGEPFGPRDGMVWAFALDCQC